MRCSSTSTSATAAGSCFTDNYFDGWKAYLRPYGVEGEGVNAQGESIEEQLPLYRADGTFRAVYLPEAGQWTVRFVYSPRSLLVGIYVSFLAAIALLLLVGWWAWGRYYRGEGSEVGTVAKNSAVQMVMSLVNKGIDFVFAMLRLRVLSPSGEGSYAFAIAFYTFFEIITRYGLGTLLTRDVALDRRHANRYLVNVIGLRTLLWLVSLPVMLLVALFYRVVLHELTAAEAQTMAIFAGGAAVRQHRRRRQLGLQRIREDGISRRGVHRHRRRPRWRWARWSSCRPSTWGSWAWRGSPW